MIKFIRQGCFVKIQAIETYYHRCWACKQFWQDAHAPDPRSAIHGYLGICQRAITMDLSKV